MPNKFARNYDETIKKLEEEANKSGGGNADPRFYKPRFGADGTFSCLMRLLPAPGDEVPLVKIFSHNINGKSGRYVEECPTTIGGQCPVCDLNTQAWNNNQKDLARSRSRNKSGICNVLIINDPQTPENNGKVFLYRFGKKILEKIVNTNSPSEKDRQLGKKAIKVFDYYEGANFRVIGVKKTVQMQHGSTATFPDYTQSEFDSPSALGEDDYLEQIESKLTSLSEFIDTKRFKSYEELYTEFNKVMQISGPVIPQGQPAMQPQNVAPPTVPQQGQPAQPASAVQPQNVAPPTVPQQGQPAQPTIKQDDVPPFDVESSTDEDEAAFFESVKARAKNS